MITTIESEAIEAESEPIDEVPIDVAPTAKNELIAAELADTEPGIGSVVDLLLKNQSSLNLLLRTDAGQRWLIPRFLTVAMCCFAFYGVIATLMLNICAEEYYSWMRFIPASRWNDTSVANLTISYAIGLIAANGICLPSFYFYGLLAGVRMTMVGVAAHALKGMAVGALALVGIVPIYFAVVLSAVVFPAPETVWRNFTLLGLALPFLAGIWGAVSLYHGFCSLGDTLADRCGRDRVCFFRRLIFFWTNSYLLVTPLVIYTIWYHLGEILG